MKTFTAVIDRIEEGIATVIPDDGSEIFNLPVTEEFSEGQTVIITENGIRAADECEKPERNNKERLSRLFNKSKKDR